MATTSSSCNQQPEADAENRRKSSFPPPHLLAISESYPVIAEIGRAFKTMGKIEDRMQLGSLIAPHLPMSTTAEVLGCCRSTVHNMRVYAQKFGAGTKVPAGLVLRNRVWDRDLTLIEFFDQEDVVFASPTLRNGKQVVYKLYSNKVLLILYQKYCSRRGVLSFKRSAFMKRLRLFGYRKWTQKTCLCNQCNTYGFRNFDEMKSICRELLLEIEGDGGKKSRESLIQQINDIHNYYWGSFRSDLELSTPVGILCLTHGLSKWGSSTGESTLYSASCEHEHSGNETAGYVVVFCCF